MLQMFEAAGGNPGIWPEKKVTKNINGETEVEYVDVENRYLIMGDYVDRG